MRVTVRGSRGSIATQPTGAPRAYARSPGTFPAFTYRSCLRRFPSPFPAVHSGFESRHHVHQQPAHAPRGPKSVTRSGQPSGVSGTIRSRRGLGDRRRIYRHPPAPAVIIHDWIWKRWPSGRRVSWMLLKRLNLVQP